MLFANCANSESKLDLNYVLVCTLFYSCHCQYVFG